MFERTGGNKGVSADLGHAPRERDGGGRDRTASQEADAMLDRAERDVHGAEEALRELVASRRAPANPSATNSNERLQLRIRVARRILERADATVGATDAGRARLDGLTSRLRRITEDATRNGPAPQRDALPFRQQMEAAFDHDFSRVSVTLGASTEMDAIGAHAVTTGEHLTFASHDPGPELVAHELTHVVQQRRGGVTETQAKSIAPGERDALEMEADAVAARVSSGGVAGEIRGATAGTGLRKDKGGSPTPDLGGAPYEWVSGTFRVNVRVSWFRSAADFEEGSRWRSPTRIRELLTHLRSKGMLSWVTDEVIRRAGDELDISPLRGEVAAIDLQAPVFHVVGLPPGRQSMVALTSSNGLDVILAVPEVKGEFRERVELTNQHKQQTIAALEQFTGLSMRPEFRTKIEKTDVRLELGAGTLHAALSRETCRQWFGPAAYDAWLTRKQKEPASEGGAFGVDTGQVTDLSTDEVAFVQKWLATNLKSSAGPGRAVVPTRHLLELLQRVEQHDHRARIIKLLTTPGKPGAAAAGLATDVLERAIHQAEFEAARAGYGFDELETGDGRAPTFDQPIEFKIDQRAGLVLSGESVPFRVEIDWPPAYTADQASDLTWRNMGAELDWVFERELPKGGRKQERRHVVTRGGSDGVSYKFELEPGETSAVWTVHAFLQHSHFQPAHKTTQVEVKTEQKRLEELRTKSFAGLGSPRIDDDNFNFDTSLYNETFGDDEYDKGILFRGDLPTDFARRTTDQRLSGLDSSIKQQEALLAYLQKDGRHTDAIAAAEHQLAKLRDARKTIESDDGDGWRPFEVRGFFLGRGNHVMDGELEVLGAVHHMTIGTTKVVKVQLRDLSRRLTADNYRFEGIADSFQLAFERAFVDLCKKYPAGRVSVLGEELTRDGGGATGKTVGFELDTGTEWEDTKSVVFDPIVNVVVNIGSAIVMIFLPATIPVLLPATIAYNTTQTVDQMVDAWTSGNLTWGSTLLSLGQIGLDLMPLLSRARMIQSSKRAFVIIEGLELAGQTVVMTLQAHQQIADIRDQDVAQMAELYAQLVELETSTHASDPRLITLRAEIEEKAKAIRNRTKEVWDQLVKDQLISLVPVKAAMHINRHRGDVKLKRLDEQGVIEHRENIEPFYDPRTGKIVGDQRHMDLATLDRLTAEQDAHMRGLASDLATELGVDPSKVTLKPDATPAIWRDGDRIEARYTPGSDPVQTLATWARQARAAKIADAPAKTAARPKKRRSQWDEDDGADGIRTHAPEPVHHVGNDELRQPHDNEARETTALAVPGSDFRPADNVVASQTKLRKSLESAVTHVPDVTSLVSVDSAHITKADDRARAEQTYLVRAKNGQPPPHETDAFTIRITTGPMPPNVVARTVVNPTKEGSSRVAGKDESIRGRFVIQLSDRVPPDHYERAVAHELAEILAERALADQQRRVGPDALRPTDDIPEDAELSPHDLGRLKEIEVLVAKDTAGKEHELHALIEHLGLREGAPGSAVRRALAFKHLNQAAKDEVKRFGRPEPELDAVQNQHRDAVVKKTSEHAKDASDRAHYERPLHERPDAPPRDGRLEANPDRTPTRAAQLASQAAIHRENQSAATVAELRAQVEAKAREGKRHRIKAPLLGAGAALAAREPGRLLIDARGRWQADPSTYIAQTAGQLKGLIDAGIGDPYQFATPDGRVPLSAVKYWEDSIAAQGPVVNGTARLELDGNTLLLHIHPADGTPPITVEVEGTPTIASGFPPERIPGTPYGMTPAKALADIDVALRAVEADATKPEDTRTRAAAARSELSMLSGQGQGEPPTKKNGTQTASDDKTPASTDKTKRESDLAAASEILQRHGLDELINKGAADAHAMVKAGEQWHAMRRERPERVFLGDEANLNSFDPSVTDDWVIGGTGGTGISAAEIILDKNKKARVALIGREFPAGLIENDQFREVLRNHADPPTIALMKANGVDVAKPGADGRKVTSDGRLSLVVDVKFGAPKVENGTYRIADGTPAGYDAKTNNPFVGGGYIAAIGRDNQLPPMVADLVDRAMRSRSARDTKLDLEVEPLFDGDRQYIGYRASLISVDATVVSVDVTGAASRFLPEEHVPAKYATELQLYNAAKDLDAPPESGNFDGGYVASATQAARYARDRRDFDGRPKG